jgi:hypothetical protein
MPGVDKLSDIIGRITGVEMGPVPQMSNTPKYLVIRGTAAAGPREVLISEAAARELLAKLKELLPVVDSE